MTREQNILAELFQPLVAHRQTLAMGGGALGLMLVYFLYGSRAFFSLHLAQVCLADAPPADLEFAAALYQFMSAFVLLFCLPLAGFALFSNLKVSDLGLGLGDKRLGGIVVLAGLLLIALPGGWLASARPEFLAEYPMARSSMASVGRLFGYQLAYGLLYYVAWEAFFRGFLIFGLKDRIGTSGAILFQTVASTLLHIGKPDGEIWAALLAGLLFGSVVLRLRSIWPLVIVHWALGIATDLSCAAALGILP